MKYIYFVGICFIMSCIDDPTLETLDTASGLDSAKYDFDSVFLNCSQETLMVFPETWDGTVCEICGASRVYSGDTLLYEGTLNASSFSSHWILDGDDAFILKQDSQSVTIVFGETFEMASLHIEEESESKFCTESKSIWSSSQSFEYGEQAEGGLLIYDKGTYSDGWRYIECSVAYLGEVSWGLDDIDIEKASSIEIGHGYANSWWIFDSYYQNKAYLDENSSPAVEYALRFQNNYYNNWYMPSAMEASLAPAYLEEGLYWTSTTPTDSTAIVLNTITGSLDEVAKSSKAMVLAVRYF